MPAAVGLASLLVLILKSDEVRSMPWILCVTPVHCGQYGAALEPLVNLRRVCFEAAHENEPRLAVPSCHGMANRLNTHLPIWNEAY